MHDFEVQFSYIMEVLYLAISKHGLYAAIPTEYDIRIWMAAEGFLCMLNQTLYPVETLECFVLLYLSPTKTESINTV